MFVWRVFSILFIPMYAYLEIGILHIIVSLTDLMSTYLPRLSYLLHFSWWVLRGSICSNFWRENSAMWDLFTNPVLKRKEYNNTEDHQVRNWANQSHFKSYSELFLLEQCTISTLRVGTELWFQKIYLVQLIDNSIFMNPKFQFPNLRCCKVFFLFNIASYIGIFGCFLISI